MTWFRILRTLFLLLLLAAVAFYSKTQKLKSQSWTETLKVVVYPVNAEDSPEVSEYIATLTAEDFAEIDEFFQRESRNYSVLAAMPTKTELGAELTETPPKAPSPSSSPLSILWWGLKFRYWAFRHTPDSESNHHRVRVFVHYHEAEKNRTLQHSLGMDKGLLAIVHAFGDKEQQAQNNVIIAHELLHTVGASDKYDHNNRPAFPDGYAEPDRQPLYPQKKAEIMAARIPLSGQRARMAENLRQCVINRKTAMEINWLPDL